MTFTMKATINGKVITNTFVDCDSQLDAMAKMANHLVSLGYGKELVSNTPIRIK